MQNKIVQGAPPDSSGKPMSRRSEQLLPGRTPINENVSLRNMLHKKLDLQQNVSGDDLSNSPLTQTLYKTMKYC